MADAPLPVKRFSVPLTLGGELVELDVRAAGSGPALLLLHPSPLSSAFMVPLMQRLASHALVIAPDTPGYGESDSLPDAFGDATLAPYVETLGRLMDSLGLDSFAVYGSATGAQIAIELAKAMPERVSGVVLDNAAHFSDDDRATIMDGYFPDVTASDDGSHLARVWQLAHDSTLFFPWHHRSEANRLSPEPGPVAAMDATFVGYLNAGPGYDRAYRAAFANERVERVQAIKVPVRIIRWPGSLLARYTDRFDGYEWNVNVQMARCGPSVEERFACIEKAAREILANKSARFAEPAVGRRSYLKLGSADVRYQRARGNPTRLILAPIGASLASVPDEWLDDGDVLVELPGCGQSVAIAGLRIAHLLRILEQIAGDVADDAPLSLAGIASSQTLADKIAGRSERLELVSTVGQFWPDQEPPVLTPDVAGSHWWQLWQWLRAAHFGAGVPLPSANLLTRQLLDIMASKAATHTLRRLG